MTSSSLLSFNRARRSSGDLPRLARLVAGGTTNPPSRDEMAALLLPMVKRVIQTGRGPTTLVQWIQRTMGRRELATTPNTFLAHSADDLIRLILGSPDPHAETLRDVLSVRDPESSTRRNVLKVGHETRNAQRKPC